MTSTNTSPQIVKNCTSLSLRFSINTQKEICSLQLLDQTQLPQVEHWITIQSTQQMIEAIQKLQVRGAPLIGVAASFQLAQEAFFMNINTALSETQKNELLHKAQKLYEARPTAVNLMNCIDRLKKILNTSHAKNNQTTKAELIHCAISLFEEDVKLCDQISKHGESLIEDGDQILTHCNTGGLATAGLGTALGVIIKAHQNGKKIHVYVDETRPLLQGGRLTTWELQKHQIPMTLITDNMAAQLMSLKKINKAIVGSDRIAVNGDFANKIGTYSVAVNCHYHNIPFYVAAPYTTVDPLCLQGQDIPIEQRNALEVRGAQGSFGQLQWAPQNCSVYNPSFDVTPATLTTAWIMDKGVFTKVDIEKGIFKTTSI